MTAAAAAAGNIPTQILGAACKEGIDDIDTSKNGNGKAFFRASARVINEKGLTRHDHGLVGATCLKKRHF